MVIIIYYFTLMSNCFYDDSNAVTVKINREVTVRVGNLVQNVKMMMMQEVLLGISVIGFN